MIYRRSNKESKVKICLVVSTHEETLHSFKMKLTVFRVLQLSMTINLSVLKFKLYEILNF